MNISDLEHIINSAKEDILAHQKEHVGDERDFFLSFLEQIAVKYANRKSSFDVSSNGDTIADYQKLIHDTLNEYNITNEKIHSISSESSLFLKESSSFKGLAKTEDISKYFVDFQEKINEELERANQTIRKLRNEIKTLEDTTNVDPLTNVYNRRGLQNYLEPILESATNKQLDMWVILLDIDDFKIVNDTFGHVAGDKVLIFLSKVLKSITRNADHVFRYGGEEFMIILNRLTKEKALQISERILKTVERNKLIYKNNTINITLSIGLSRHEKGDNVETLVDRTDKLLYKAKKSGKNQIIMQGDA